MKIALVHDYLNEFGGAERVLETLSEIYPDAPIYTAFVNKNSSAYQRFKDRKIITSWAQNVPFFASYLHSPLRFLAPLIWNSFDFSGFDVVIGSASWYVTKGFRKVTRNQKPETRNQFVEICYCHTPPRYLYGYPTSVDWQKYWPVRIYAALVNHFMRVYDFEAAQRVDHFIANSKEVAARIKKFYRRESTVIYPPVDIKKFQISNFKYQISNKNKKNSRIGNWKLEIGNSKKYFLVVSRLVASKKVDIAVEVCAKLRLPLKVVGVGKEEENLKKVAAKYSRSDLVRKTKSDLTVGTVEFLGEVLDEDLVKLYQGARAVIFPAQMEDFGLVPVEAAAAGKPVIANAEGGVLETVIDWPAGKGKCTGVYFDPATSGSLTLAINNFVDLEKKDYFDPVFIKKHAQKFSKDRFKREIKEFMESVSSS